MHQSVAAAAPLLPATLGALEHARAEVRHRPMTSAAMSTGTPSGIKAVQAQRNDADALANETVWVLEQAPADQLRSTRRFAFRSLAT